MQNFRVLQTVFRIFGIVLPHYDPITNRYKENLNHLVYTSCLTVAIQIFNLYFLSTDLRSIVDIKILVNENHVWLSKIIVTIDFLLLFLGSISTVVNIFIHRKTLTKLLNTLLNFQLCNNVAFSESPHFKRRIYALTSLLIVYMCLVPVLSERINNRLGSFMQYLYLVLLYCVVVQYYIGHVFEFVLFEYLNNYFEQLLCQLRPLCRQKQFLRQCITVQSDLWLISTKFIKLFELNKIICLTFETLLLSIYWFYSIDFTRLNLLLPLMWQTLVSIIFLTCHSWHRLTMQVSNLLVN